MSVNVLYDIERIFLDHSLKHLRLKNLKKIGKKRASGQKNSPKDRILFVT